MFGFGSRAPEALYGNNSKSGNHRGLKMVILHLLRVLTVIVLAAAAMSFGVLMVKVKKDKTYFPFEAASDFFMALICLVLIVSEYPLMRFIREYFRRSWPAFSDKHGLTFLGLAMFFLGCNLLGRLNEPAYAEDKLGLSLFQLVLAAGVLSLTLGCLNAICSLICSDRKNGITARAVRSKGAEAQAVDSSFADGVLPTHYSVRGTPTSSIKMEKKRSRVYSMFWKKDQQAGKNQHRPIISGPLSAHEGVENDHDGERGSPIVPGMQRPPSAMHPMRTGHSSIYSAADISRF